LIVRGRCCKISCLFSRAPLREGGMKFGVVEVIGRFGCLDAGNSDPGEVDLIGLHPTREIAEIHPQNEFPHQAVGGPWPKETVGCKCPGIIQQTR
jgi:hypothetical protein